MKNIFYLILAVLLIIPSNSESQNRGDGVVAAVAGLAAIGSAIAMNSHLKEMAELRATEWVIENHPEFSSFSLKLLDFNAKKGKDKSNVNVVTYKLQLFTPKPDAELDGKKYILFNFLSRGWANQHGVDYTKFKFHLVDKEEWIKMMISYVKSSSQEKDENSIQKTLRAGKVVNKGVKVSGKLKIPFFKLEEDMYVVSDYSSLMKLLYNERSLGVFLKDTNDLIQMGRDDIIKIHDYLLDKE